MLFLIMELYRLIPFTNESNEIKFHPLNIPDFTIKRMQIVGTIAEVNTNKKFVTEVTGKVYIFI